MTAYHRSTHGGFQSRYPAKPDLTCLPWHANPLAQDICRTLHQWPSEIDIDSKQGLKSIEVQIRRALREQRRRALAGHWSYDLACHARLLELAGRLKKHIPKKRRRRRLPRRRRAGQAQAASAAPF